MYNVQPTNIATFAATQWQGEDADPCLEWMANEFGWTLKGVRTSTIRGKEVPHLFIIGRSKKQYRVHPGEWVVALGASGSIRVCSDTQFQQDYKEVF